MTIQSFGLVPLALVQRGKQEPLGTGCPPKAIQRLFLQFSSLIFQSGRFLQLLFWPFQPHSSYWALLKPKSFALLGWPHRFSTSAAPPLLSLTGRAGNSLPSDSEEFVCWQNPTLGSAVLAWLLPSTLQHFLGSASKKNIFTVLRLFCYLPLTAFSKVF